MFGNFLCRKLGISGQFSASKLGEVCYLSEGWIVCRLITETIKTSKEESLIVNDWKFAAIVLDRVCLLIFTVFTLVATLALFTTAPHILVN